MFLSQWWLMLYQWSAAAVWLEERMVCATGLTQSALHLSPHASYIKSQLVSGVEVRERPGSIILTHIFFGLQMLTFSTSLFTRFWLFVANAAFCVSPLLSEQTTCKVFFPSQTALNRAYVCCKKYNFLFLFSSSPFSCHPLRAFPPHIVLRSVLV